MDQVLFNIDLFDYIIHFIPKIYCIYLNSICKKISVKNFNKCKRCNNKLFLPININNEIYCYNCCDLEYFENCCTNLKYFITISDIKSWKYLDKCKSTKVNNICKYCNIKCSSLEFLHYHLEYKCHKIIINK